MTEEEWPDASFWSMEQYFVENASEYKQRQFACACCRQIWNLLSETRRRQLRLVEKFVDGKIGSDDLIAEFEGIEFGVEISEEAGGEQAERAIWSLAHEWINPDREGRLQTHSESRSVAESLGKSQPWEIGRRLQGEYLSDIFGNPFRPVVADPAWLTSTVRSLADAIYWDRAFDRLPILADALEEAGCVNADVLLHCREPAEHVRGCWVVDLVLGKA